MEEAFPLEDILGMVRPFVLPGENGEVTAGHAGGPFVVFVPADSAGPLPVAEVKTPEGAPRAEVQGSKPGDFTVRRGSAAPGVAQGSPGSDVVRCAGGDLLQLSGSEDRS